MIATSMPAPFTNDDRSEDASSGEFGFRRPCRSHCYAGAGSGLAHRIPRRRSPNV